MIDRLYPDQTSVSWKLFKIESTYRLEVTLDRVARSVNLFVQQFTVDNQRLADMFEIELNRHRLDLLTISKITGLGGLSNYIDIDGTIKNDENT